MCFSLISLWLKKQATAISGVESSLATDYTLKVSDKKLEPLISQNLISEVELCLSIGIKRN